MNERIILAEFHDGRPFSLVRDNGRGLETVAVEYCRRDDRLYYHLSGFGPRESEWPVPLDYWLAPDAGLEVTVRPRLVQQPDGTRAEVLPVRLETLPAGFDPETFLTDLTAAEECECVYCGVCDDWLPRDEEQPCAHLRRCGECGDFTGGGAADPCDCEAP